MYMLFTHRNTPVGVQILCKISRLIQFFYCIYVLTRVIALRPKSRTWISIIKRELEFNKSKQRKSPLSLSLSLISFYSEKYVTKDRSRNPIKQKIYSIIACWRHNQCSIELNDQNVATLVKPIGESQYWQFLPLVKHAVFVYTFDLRPCDFI